jgi:Ca2+-binding EF-hand superfamily protein
MSDQQAQSTNFKEAFSLFDKRGNGRVALPDLGDLLRACGQNPTLAEIKDLESQMGGDCKATQETGLEATGVGTLTQRYNSRLR